MSRKSEQETGSTKNSDRQNFVRRFLFGDAAVERGDGCLRTDLLMDARTEGWIGIPHGGIGMGAIMELATMLDSYPRNAERRYPMSLEFRMGGPSVRIGDRLSVEVAEREKGAEGEIFATRDDFPYIAASIKYGDPGPHGEDPLPACIPGSFSDIEDRLTPLPYYINCFVCGVGRTHPGLARRFYFLDGGALKGTVVSLAGFDLADSRSISRFQKDGCIHPIATLALMDETLGWGGFMIAASGAVTVRISYTLHRDIMAGERFVVCGRGDRVRGKGARMMFWASGALASVRSDGSLETAITASGQWLGVPELTRQMREELIPKELTEQAFLAAGAH